MAERPPSDPDDWFDEPEPLTEELRSSLVARRRRPIDRTGSQPGAEGWTRPVAAVVGLGRASRRRSRSIVVALAGGVVLLVVLAAAGIFSSSASKRAKPPLPETSTVARTQTAAATTTKAAPASPSATLKPGDSGAEVRSLQRALAYLGFPVGSPDGVYGPATRSALARFQRSRGLTADGVLGPVTLHALTVALRR
jgi:Putative peptidoglycan binding domain